MRVCAHIGLEVGADSNWRQARFGGLDVLNARGNRDIVPWLTQAVASEPDCMRHFWTRNTAEPTCPTAHRHHYPVNLALGGRLAERQGSADAKETLFRARDWASVAHIVENDAMASSAPGSMAPGDELAASLAKLRASLNSPILRTGPVIYQLIDVWAFANEVDAEAARPAEALLCAMAGCDLVTAGQVSAACDQVDLALRRSPRSH